MYQDEGEDEREWEVKLWKSYSKLYLNLILTFISSRSSPKKLLGVAVILMTSSVQAGSFSEYFPSDLFSTSLVLLEAAIPAPHTLVQLQNERKKAQEKDDEMMVLVDTA